MAVDSKYRERAQTADEAAMRLHDAAGEAFEFLEHFCNCKLRNIPAKRLRLTLEATRQWANPEAYHAKPMDEGETSPG